MLERTAEPANEHQPDTAVEGVTVPGDAMDRECWKTLRSAAYNGRLQPQGFVLVDIIHALHPEWRVEW
jgi:hypothetical protein